MIGENKKTIEKLFVLDKMMQITKYDIKYIDECKFAFCEIDGREYSYYLNGANVQTLSQKSSSRDTRYLGSVDSKSLEFIRDFVQDRMRNVIGEYAQLSRKIGEEYFR